MKHVITTTCKLTKEAKEIFLVLMTCSEKNKMFIKSIKLKIIQKFIKMGWMDRYSPILVTIAIINTMAKSIEQGVSLYYFSL